mmetsp:Transcript_5546/g.17558  ORF Transcript_5546/g.17558 Transcript_5546/m.17558 type:complete len:400 (-) Transcript_5546:30-1229(-)
MRLVDAQRAQEQLEAREVDVVLIREVAAHLREELAVRHHHQVQRAVDDVEVRQVRQEVVADEHADEDKVVDDALQVKVVAPVGVEHRHRRRRRRIAGRQEARPELQLEHLAQEAHLEEFEVVALVVQRVLWLAVAARVAHRRLLAQKAELWLVRHEREHDEIGVEAIKAMLQVLELRELLGLLAPDKVHHLVLALAGHVGPGEHDDRAVRVKRVRLELVRQPRAEPEAQAVHELRAGCDAVRVERALNVLLLGVAQQQFALERRPEPPRALLVHLRARRDAVDGEVDDLLRAHDLQHFVGKREDALELLALAHRSQLGLVGVRAHVDDAVHVEVQVIHAAFAVGVGGEAVGDALHDLRVLVGEPAEHLGDAMRDGQLPQRRGARRAACVETARPRDEAC